MKDISSLLGDRALKQMLKHPRHKMLDLFYQRVNTERVAQDMKPLKMSYFAFKTSHLSLDDMGFLLKKCQHSSNFSRCFFGLLKVK